MKLALVSDEKSALTSEDCSLPANANSGGWSLHATSDLKVKKVGRRGSLLAPRFCQWGFKWCFDQDVIFRIQRVSGDFS